MIRQNDAKDPVTKKFQPFVTGGRRSVAGMGQRFDKKISISKHMPDLGLECGQSVVFGA